MSKRFDATDANTWDEAQHAVYEVGHREGESCRDADWYIALSERTQIPDADAWEIGKVVAYVNALEAKPGLSRAEQEQILEALEHQGPDVGARREAHPFSCLGCVAVVVATRLLKERLG